MEEINDNFDDYTIQIDSDCVENDFDEYDLYGERMEDSSDDFGNNIEFE